MGVRDVRGEALGVNREGNADLPVASHLTPHA